MTTTRRWTLWRVRIGRSYGRWNADEAPARAPRELVVGVKVDEVEVMPVAEHEAEVARLREVLLNG